MSTGAVRIRDMDWLDMLQMLRVIGKEIGTLAQRGDRFAKRVMETYQYAFDHPRDMRANWEVRVAFEDYLTRDLIISERNELGSKYGHLLDEKPAGARIIVPEIKH